MNKNKEVRNKYEDRKSKGRNYRRGNGRRRSGNRNSKDDKPDIGSPENPILEKRGNDPSWYYLDAKLAEEVSQLSFQNLAGYPVTVDGHSYGVANIVKIGFNASPGVMDSADYGTDRLHNAGINMAAFRLYSKLAMFSGRVQTYAPQDVATLILALGSVLEGVEFIRRAFGVAYTMNMRNRSYPMDILNFGMEVDAADLYANQSTYRVTFNKLITLLNQIPIMDDIAYLRKCQSMYEKLYLDSDSPMAQTIIPVPFSEWILDEQSYSGGSVLKTIEWCCDPTLSQLHNVAPKPLSFYLTQLENMITTLLTSSTMTIIYTDLMHLAEKLNGKFIKLDYLYNEYAVAPEFDSNFMLQFHNCTVTSAPNRVTAFVSSPVAVTPYNDVYPEPNTNSLYYNPAFPTVGNLPGGQATSGSDVIVDMLTPNPSVTDRVEVTRWMSVTRGTPYVDASTNNDYIDTVLPDHYVVGIDMQNMIAGERVTHFVPATVCPDNYFADMMSYLSVIDWAPHIYAVDGNTFVATGVWFGDIEYYTTIDRNYLKKLHDFVTLALFDAR